MPEDVVSELTLIGQITGADEPPPFWLEEPLYSITRVAQHPQSGLIQVWVTGPDEAALDQFRTHYPSFEEQPGFAVAAPQEWVQMAYPQEAPGTSPCENFLNGAARAQEQSQQEEPFVLASAVVNPLRQL